MNYTPSENTSLALAYLYETYGKPGQLTKKLGAGIDGTVYYTSHRTVVKVHVRQQSYQKEVEAYERLRDHRVTSILGHAVPELIASHHIFKIVEMTIVTIPFVLDFASSIIDEKIDFESGAMDHWYRQKRDDFGTNWPKAIAIYNFLWERYGIFYHDLTPKNCCFVNPGDPLPHDDDYDFDATGSEEN